jgi:hypothetical protein
MNKTNSIRFFIFSIIILFTLACGLSINPSEEDNLTQKDLELELTRVMLQLTQIAMAEPTEMEEEASEEPESAEEPATEPKEEERSHGPAPAPENDPENESDNKEPAFAVTEVTSDLKKSYSGICPIKINFVIYIYVNGPGTVKYTEDPSPAPAGIHEITFVKAGFETFHTDIPFSGHIGTFYTGYSFYIIEPEYSEYIFLTTITCEKTTDIL